MLSKVTIRTLKNIVVGGAVVVVGTGLFFQSKIRARFKQAEYYKESFRILRTNGAVVDMVGQPIREGAIDLGDTENNFADDVSARLKVPVYGKIKNGQLYLWASRTEPSVPWMVDRLELAFKSEPTRRLLVYDRTRENPASVQTAN